MIGTRLPSATGRGSTQPGTPVLQPVLLAPLRLEGAMARIGGRGHGGYRVERVGMGPARAEAARARVTGAVPSGAPLAVLGLGGGLSPKDHAGDLVVATEVRMVDGSQAPVTLDGALAEQIRAAIARSVSRRVRTGPVVCTPRLLPAGAAASLAGTSGALACEMESLWLAPLAADHPFAVVRVIVDRPGGGLLGPWTLLGGPRALCRLASVAPVVAGVLATSTTSTTSTPPTISRTP